MRHLYVLSGFMSGCAFASAIVGEIASSLTQLAFALLFYFGAYELERDLRRKHGA